MGADQKSGAATLWLADGWILVRSTYDSDFVATIKAGVPHGMRQWDPETKLWRVDPAYKAYLLSLCRSHYTQVTFLDAAPGAKKPEPAAPDNHGDDPYAVLLRACSRESVHDVYRQAMLRVHPDRRGGDPEAARRVNAAWKQIQEEQQRNDD